MTRPKTLVAVCCFCFAFAFMLTIGANQNANAIVDRCCMIPCTFPDYGPGNIGYYPLHSSECSPFIPQGDSCLDRIGGCFHPE
jgi:hypothetical protein